MEAVAVVFGYLLGSIPFALLLTRRRGIELHNVGSGNPGAANVLRSVGVAPAVAVMIGKYVARSLELADENGVGADLKVGPYGKQR